MTRGRGGGSFVDGGDAISRRPGPSDDAGLVIDDKSSEAPAPGGSRAQEQGPPSSKKRAVDKGSWIKAHRVATVALACVALAAASAVVLWWLNARHYETTDDAFIDARPSAISAEVAGAIADVSVTDNQIVERGATLATIDDRDYLAALAQANAQIAQGEAAIATADAQTAAQLAIIDQMTEQVAAAEAALSYSKDENDRAQRLVQTGAGTVQQAQQSASDLKQKQAALDAAQAALAQSRKQLGVIAAQRKSAEAQALQGKAQHSLAEANLSRVTLVAPFKGRVTQLIAADGAYATPGQTLMMIVPLDVWVTANFRETQLADIRPGQPATISIDAYGRSFPGHVDSIQAGSGTAFSLLPAENATGNYVKIVQRVPVKIVFDHRPGLELGPGMSVTPSVKVR